MTAKARVKTTKIFIYITVQIQISQTKQVSKENIKTISSTDYFSIWSKTRIAPCTQAIAVKWVFTSSRDEVHHPNLFVLDKKRSLPSC